MPKNPDILSQEEINTRDIFEIKRGLNDLAELVHQGNKDSKDFREEIRPLLEIYNGGRFARSFIIGTGTVVGSLVAIGVGVYTLLEWVRSIH